MSDAINWLAIRTDYENGSSLRQLAAKYRVSKSAIGEHKYKEQWTARTDGGRTPDTQRGTNRDVNAAIRVIEAIKLRAQKLTYEEIARRCGYANAKSAHRAIQRELERNIVENVEELRREEGLILDIGHSECWELFMDRKNRGRLFAYDRVLETSKDRRKLFNLDVKPDELPPGVTIVREYGVDISKV